MGMIRIVRCTDAERVLYGGIETGRMFYCTDTDKVWIETAGGDVEIGAIGAADLGDLADVTVPTPADSDVLVWDNVGTTWINEPPELVIAEIFDGLNTAVINGQGAYRRMTTWTGAEVGTGTSQVTVKAGVDKMLTLVTGNPWAGNYGSALIDCNPNSYITRGAIKYIFRTSDVTGSVDVSFMEGATARFIVGTFGGQIRIRWGTGSWTNVKAIANATWYTIEVYFDSASQYISVFIDGVFELCQLLHTDSKFRYISRMFTRSYDNSVTYDIDDLEIRAHGVYPYSI